MASSVKATDGAKETILLRNPTPKYSFDGRKLPKEPENNEASKELSSRSKLTRAQSDATFDSPGMKYQLKPIAVVGASFKPKSSSPLDLQKGGNTVPPFRNQGAQPFPFKPSANNSGIAGNGMSSSPGSAINLSSQPLPIKPNSSTPELQGTLKSEVSAEDSTVVALREEPTDPQPPASAHAEQLQALQEERDKLKTELNAQIQVNTELKRLLVASVGDDLYQRVENLCRDRAQLELDIGGFSKKMSEDYENLDQISIQADMWRSKYLASRVMTEELSNAKAYIALQCHDSHSALQQLLNERYELRTNLIESYKVLQQVKNAFDPLNTHRSSLLRSTSVLDLSKACQQLSEAVRFRLLPSNVVVDVSSDVSTKAWQNSVTRAEQLAQEVLSRPVEPNGPQDSSSPQTSPGYRADASSNLYTRYHPATRFENLTYNCCTHCIGELQVM